MRKNTIIEQLCVLTHVPITDYAIDQDTQASIEDENNSPIPRTFRTHSSQKYEMPTNVDEFKTRIHEWLDSQGIQMVNPAQKEELYFEEKRFNIWAHHRSSMSSNNLSSMSCIGSQPFDDQICSPCLRSPELRQLPKLNSISDLNTDQDQQEKRKQSDSLFERRKGRMKTMQVQGSPTSKPSIYSQKKAQVQES